MDTVLTVLEALGRGLGEAFSMFWNTLWALVLGFGLSGAVQAFVSRGRMLRTLGDHRPATIGKAGVLGAVSSSCSYAAAALGRTLFGRGADFTAAMVFMFASTNLVVELGAVLWLLMGWQFALAELVGGLIMIVLLAVVLPRAVPAATAERLRERFDGGADDPGEGDAPEPGWRRARTRAGWSDAAGYTISDLTMLRRELVIGFLVAGFAIALVPTSFWQALFVTGHGFWSSLQNVLIGPLLAILAFVCSVGNVPLASARWSGGISFGGVVAFVFADLITLPLLLIYRKYYGTRVTLRLLAVFWAVMSAAGLAVEYLFAALDLVPPAPPTAAVDASHAYTTWLNVAALAVLAVLYVLYRTRGTGSGYAKDPVCGMQVETANAPVTRVRDGVTHHFCSDGCRERFDARAGSQS